MKIALISIITISLLITAISFIPKDRLIQTNATDIELSDYDFNKIIVHEFESGHSAENSVKIMKTPVGKSSCNIIITFNNYKNDDLYKICNLEVRIKPKSKVKLESVHCDYGTDSKNYFEFQDNTFTANSEDYLYIEVMVSDYSSDSIDCDIKYDINGRFTHPIKGKITFSTQIVI